MAAAQTQTLAPQLEAGVGHAFPLRACIVVGGREGVVAHVGAGRHALWNCMFHRGIQLKQADICPQSDHTV